MIPQAGIDSLGYIGGILLSLCTVPQIIKMWRTKVTSDRTIVYQKSADDISVLFIVTYDTGLAMMVAYLTIENAMAGAIPAMFELAMGFVLIFSKIYIGRYYSKGKRISENTEPNDRCELTEIIVVSDEVPRYSVATTMGENSGDGQQP